MLHVSLVTFSLLLLCLWSWIPASLADKVVYLDRLNGRLWEPYFNPDTLNADVGEKIHFVMRLGDVDTHYGVVATPSLVC